MVETTAEKIIFRYRMDNYIALGDSISISSYPSLDAGLGHQARIGAADLTGEGLLKLGHVRDTHNLACDGATTTDVINQLRLLTPQVRNQCNIITLTAGGNDISFTGMNKKRDSFEYSMERIESRYDGLVSYIMDGFPNSVLVLNTLYDPTDGTGKLPNCGSWTEIVDWYSEGRRRLGNHIRKLYGGPKINRVLFCDLFKLFDGHGMRESHKARRWYYENFMIEPGAIGAKEISQAWLSVITEFIAEQSRREQQVSFSH